MESRLALGGGTKEFSLTSGTRRWWWPSGWRMMTWVLTWVSAPRRRRVRSGSVIQPSRGRQGTRRHAVALNVEADADTADAILREAAKSLVGPGRGETSRGPAETHTRSTDAPLRRADQAYPVVRTGEGCRAALSGLRGRVKANRCPNGPWIYANCRCQRVDLPCCREIGDP